MTAPIPARPADRYGRPRRQRAGLVMAVVAVALVVLVVLVWRSSPWSGAQPSAGLVRWGPTVDGRIEVVVDVRRPGGQAATCEVRAIDRRRAVVGTAQAEVPAGEPAQVRVAVTIPVEIEAIAAEVGPCTSP